MGAVSKYQFDRLIESRNCQDIVHPWTSSCVRSNLHVGWSGIKGAGKYLALTYLVRYIYKRKKITLDDLLIISKDIGKYSISVCIYFMGYFSPLCTFSRLTGTLPYWMPAFVCPLLSSMGIFLETPNRLSIATLTYSTVAIETLIRRIYLSGTAIKSVNKETALAMLVNAALMYAVRKMKTENSAIPTLLWFYSPPHVESCDKSKQLCPHNHSTGTVIDCIDDIANSCMKFFCYGSILPLLKIIISSPKVLMQPFDLLSSYLFWSNIRQPIFLATYIGIYKAVSCYLVHRFKGDSINISAVAGFLSGISYKIYPNLTVLASLIVCVLKVAGTRASQKGYVKAGLPYEKIAGLLAHAFVEHSLFFLPGSLPRVYIATLHAVSLGSVTNIAENIQRMVAENDLNHH